MIIICCIEGHNFVNQVICIYNVSLTFIWYPEDFVVFTNVSLILNSSGSTMSEGGISVLKTRGVCIEDVGFGIEDKRVCIEDVGFCIEDKGGLY